jgi:hypothetical protein
MKPGWLLLALAACSTAKPTPPVDAVLQREDHAARASYSLERPAEAAASFRAALARARMRDDLPAIADSGYNLTVAELRAGDAAAALRDARALRAELARAGYGDLPALDLVEATAAYRLGDSDQADQVAAAVQACSDRDAAAQAVFLRGLIADERGDLQGLQQESARLAHSGPPGDATELAARVHLRAGDATGARALALQAVDQRRMAQDYRGLARALALAAEAAGREGNDGMAADLFLRAGRSAGAQGDMRQARTWLAAARSLGQDAMLRAAIAQAEADIQAPK